MSQGPPVVAGDAAGTELVGTALGRGEVVVIPTETVYGVAVLPDRPGAIDRLFSVKARPPSVAVAVLVADSEQAAQLAAEPLPRRLVERHWPGPLTLVVRRHPDIEWDLGGDPTTIGIRCPDHELVRNLCRRLGPIATTSANRHGEATPPTAAGVAEALAGGGVSLVLDGGVCEGEPSSVVDLTGDQPRVLREGAVSGEDLLA